MNNFSVYTGDWGYLCVWVLSFVGKSVWTYEVPASLWVSHSLLLLTFQTGSYDLNPEGMMTFKGKNTSRYSYLVQGHENPYFLPGDEKKNWN